MGTAIAVRNAKIREAAYRHHGGESLRSIAVALGVSHSTVNKWVKSKLWLETWDQIELEVSRARLHRIEKAAQEINQIRDSLVLVAKANLESGVRAQIAIKKAIAQVSENLQIPEQPSIRDLDMLCAAQGKIARSVSDCLEGLANALGLNVLAAHLSEASDANRS